MTNNTKRSADFTPSTTVRKCDACQANPSQHPNGLCNPCEQQREAQSVDDLMKQLEQRYQQGKK